MTVLCHNGKHELPFKQPCPECRKLSKNRTRTLERNFRPAPDWIPTWAITEVINEYLRQEEARANVVSGPEFNATRPPILESLCARAGMTTRQIHRWRSGESRFARLEEVDRLIVAMDDVWAWHVPPLAEFYFAGLEDSLAA